MKKYLSALALLILLPSFALGQKMGFENDNVLIEGGGVISAAAGLVTISERMKSVNKRAATGGTITESGGFTIHTYTSSGTFTPNDITSVEVLVVGAGGGSAGGGAGAGGGGGGQVVTNSSFAVRSDVTVTIGPGVSGGTGGSSLFGTITATGGLGGANNFGVGGTSGNGFAGGAGETNNGACTTTLDRRGGGGGGASAVGTDAAGAAAGNGGDGVQNSISGTVTFYGGGGGGGAERGTAGTGGQGGGANGGSGSGGASGNNGTANTGGGSGGAGGLCNVVGNIAATGGSGIVIARYTTPITGAFTDSLGYVGILTTSPGGALGIKDATTYIDRDGSNNLTFTDAVTGTKTLAQLSASGSSGVTGSVQFSDGAGGFSSDGTNLFWDDTNNRLGIGIAIPVSSIHARSNDNTVFRAEATFGDSDALFQTLNDFGVWSFGVTGIDDSFNIANAFDLATNIRMSIALDGVVNVFGVWKAWTPTFTGFSTAPVVNAARYMQAGKMVSVYWSTNNGTSNATTFTITLPIAAANTSRQFFSCAVATDNGAANTSPAMLRTNINSTTADIFKNSASAAWANIGGKKAQCSFTYETN